MRIKIIYISLLAFILLSTSSFVTNDYFNEKYKEAFLLYRANASLIRSQCASEEKFQICSAVAFPEFIRYSKFKDFFETGALKSGYVMGGVEIADFSIGYCQMKPSFIEKLETCLWNSDSLQQEYSDLIQFSEKSAQGIRRERIDRLESPSWQFRYLSCFYDIVEQNTHDILWKSPEDKIRFYSTAYNYDFQATRARIISMSSEKYFPYGAGYEENQYAYSDISIQFFKSYFKTQNDD